MYSPVGSLHITLALRAWCSVPFFGNAICGLEAVVEVSITSIAAFVYNCLGARFRVRGSCGESQEAREEHLQKSRREGKSEICPKNRDSLLQELKFTGS